MSPQKRLTFTIILVIITLAAFGIFTWVRQLPLTAKITVEAVPIGVSIKINGNPAKNGVNKVRPGMYEVTASRQGFTDNSQVVKVNKGSTHFLGFILAPNSPSTADWYTKHPDDQQKSQDISSKSNDALAQQLTEKNLIVQNLPFIDNRSGFRIDYGPSPAHPTDAGAVAITITTTGTQQAKDAALGWLRFMGYDPTKLEIVYKTF